MDRRTERELALALQHIYYPVCPRCGSRLLGPYLKSRFPLWGFGCVTGDRWICPKAGSPLLKKRRFPVRTELGMIRNIVEGLDRSIIASRWNVSISAVIDLRHGLDKPGIYDDPVVRLAFDADKKEFNYEDNYIVRKRKKTIDSV